MGAEKVRANLSIALGKAVASAIDILGDTVKDIIEDNRDDVKNIVKTKIDKAFEGDVSTTKKKTEVNKKV